MEKILILPNFYERSFPKSRTKPIQLCCIFLDGSESASSVHGPTTTGQPAISARPIVLCDELL